MALTRGLILLLSTLAPCASPPDADLSVALLRNAAAQTKDLKPLDRAEALDRICSAAIRLKMPEAKRWINELAGAAGQLDDAALRIRYQTGAVETLAAIDPKRAWQGLLRIQAPDDAGDSRVVAARVLLQMRWSACNKQCAAEIEERVLTLSTHKIAPYRAIDGVLDEVTKADPELGRRLLALAIQSYKRGTDTEDVAFVDLLADAQQTGDPRLIHQGADLAVARLFPAASTTHSEEAPQAITAGLPKGGGPLVMETETERARRELYNLVASYDPGKAHELDLIDASLHENRPPAPEMGVQYVEGQKITAGAQFSISAALLSRRIATGEIDLNQVEQLTDPLMRAVGLAFFSEGPPTSTAGSPELLAQARKTIAASPETFQKLRALAIVAKIAAKAGNLDLARTSMEEAFAFGPQLADQELENNEANASTSDDMSTVRRTMALSSNKITVTDGYSGLECMVDAVASTLTTPLLTEIKQLHNSGIRAFLLIRVASQIQPAPKT